MVQRIRYSIRENRIFIRVFFAIFCIALFATVLLAAVMSTSTSRYVRERQALIEETIQVSNLDTMLENHLTTARQSMEMLASNPHVKQQMALGATDWNNTMYNISIGVRQALGVDAVFSSVYIISGEDVLLKSLRNFQPLSYDDLMVEMVVSRVREQLIPWSFDFADKPYRFAALIVGMEGLEAPNTNGGFIVNLNMDKLASKIFRETADSFVITDRQGRILLSTDMSSFGQPVESILPQLGKTENQGRYIFQDEAYLLTRWSNASFGYTIHHLIPYGQYAQPINAAVTTLLLIAAGVLVAAFCIALITAQRVYRPVKGVFVQLISQFPSPATTESGAMDELQQATQTIVHTYETISSYTKSLRHSTLRGLLTSGATSEKDIAETEALLEFKEGTRLMVLVLSAPEDEQAVDIAAGVITSYVKGSGRVVDVPTGHC